MKNLLQKINRISKGVLSSLILGVGAMTLLPVLGSEARADIIISEDFTWKALSSAQHTCQTFRHTVIGPGMISIRLKMNPFRERMFAMSKEDIITSNLPDFAEYKGFAIYGTANVNPDSYVGKPIDRIVKYKIPGKTFNLDFKVCNPVNCNFAGACSQPAAAATVIIDYTPDSVSGPSIGAAQNITWATQADNLRGRNGQQFTFVCPAGGTISGRLWGTDLYTDDSSVCTAAVHAGLITAQSGGKVTIEIRAGASAYQSTTRYGVTSRGYGGWSGSFVFVKGGVVIINGGTTGATKITWTTQADGWRGQNGRRYKLQCPSGGTISSRLWGTNLYTDDSSICTAAVHAGLISTAGGGVVTIEIRAGANSYVSSTRNAVTSRGYGGWDGSFVFVQP